MTIRPHLKHFRRWLAGGVTTVFFVTLCLTLPPTPTSAPAMRADPIRKEEPRAWPMFGGTAARNQVNVLERNIPDNWDVQTGKNIRWVAQGGSRSHTAPVVAGGRIFIGTNNERPRDPRIVGDRGVLMCFRESDGAFLWQAVHRKLETGNVNDWPLEGIASCPVVEGNRLYYVSNRCELVCADVEGSPKTGAAKIVWVLDMRGLGVFPHNLAVCSPVVAGDTVFVVTGNGTDESHTNIPAPEAPSFLAVNKETGRVRWQNNEPTIQSAQIGPDNAEFDKSRLKQLIERGSVVMHSQWSNPVIALGQVIFPGGDGWLRSFERLSGRLVWKFDANPKEYTYLLGGRGKRSDFIATPVVCGNRLYIATGQDPEHYEGVGHLWCIDITRTGDVSSELVTEVGTPPRTKPNPNSAVVWHYGGPTTPADEKKLDRAYYFGRSMSTCAVHDGLVYVAELAGYLHCVDASTGKPYWVHDLRAAVWGSPYWVDGKVFVATEDGDVWVFGHGKQKPEPKKIELGKPIRTTPTAVNGVLYIMTETDLFAIARK